ncbi:MAG: CYTH domain-containing protein [Aliidiomarina sp.]|uniref:CYTH domain-containing protein n=1 Tax=Aliidiomarina sp. TaxID=1872439 RepID=UPI0025C39566|nr:CYTH domain-containing protein [Aliidiomarina sp.]MCH8502170.1 CYTH domain-containing protein [Aliidiomarina sp.]
MSQDFAEIELKYLIEKNKINDLQSYLNTHLLPQTTLQLANIYFDTRTTDLGNAKIGLRIRRWNDQCEQTIKFAGRSAGALSERPEYTVPCTTKIPNLALFPTAIWPENWNLDSLQEELIEQFRTDFTRQRWLLTRGDSVAEVALDRGMILAAEQAEEIAELEVEMQRGHLAELLPAIEHIRAEFSLLPGSKSKAQRGYALLARSQRKEL